MDTGINDWHCCGRIPNYILYKGTLNRCTINKTTGLPEIFNPITGLSVKTLTHGVEQGWF